MLILSKKSAKLRVRYHKLYFAGLNLAAHEIEVEFSLSTGVEFTFSNEGRA